MLKLSIRPVLLAAILGILTGGVVGLILTVTLSPETPADKLAASLAAYGYVPVSAKQLDANNKMQIFVTCGHVAMKECAQRANDFTSNTHPAVIAWNGKVTSLVGSRADSVNERIGKTEPYKPNYHYYITVPDTYADFVHLDQEQQKRLLGIMPSVAQAVDAATANSGSEPSGSSHLSIGETQWGVGQGVGTL